MPLNTKPWKPKPAKTPEQLLAEQERQAERMLKSHVKQMHSRTRAGEKYREKTFPTTAAQKAEQLATFTDVPNQFSAAEQPNPAAKPKSSGGYKFYRDEHGKWQKVWVDPNTPKPLSKKQVRKAFAGLVAKQKERDYLRGFVDVDPVTQFDRKENT